MAHYLLLRKHGKLEDMIRIENGKWISASKDIIQLLIDEKKEKGFTEKKRARKALGWRIKKKIFEITRTNEN